MKLKEKKSSREDVELNYKHLQRKMIKISRNYFHCALQEILKNHKRSYFYKQESGRKSN